MKKDKTIITVTIGLICFLLIMVMCMQFKIVYETDLTSIETMRSEDLQAELASWKTKYEQAEEKYKEINETLKKYNEESSSDSKSKKNMEEELKNLELMLGTTAVQGEGIIITLSDEEADDRNKIDETEFILIVNYLKDAGAEAIEINGERIISSTFFAYIRSSYIKINGNRVSSPYTIKVIGDPDYLKSALLGTGGYAEKLISKGQTIEFQTKKKIEIDKYKGNDLNTKYINKE